MNSIRKEVKLIKFLFWHVTLNSSELNAYNSPQSLGSDRKMKGIGEAGETLCVVPEHRFNHCCAIRGIYILENHKNGRGGE